MKLYGCNNKPREAKPLLVQDGYVDTGMTMYYEDQKTMKQREIVRVPRMVSIPRVNSIDCRYEKRSTDTGCTDCKHV